MTWKKHTGVVEAEGQFKDEPPPDEWVDCNIIHKAYRKGETLFRIPLTVLGVRYPLMFNGMFTVSRPATFWTFQPHVALEWRSVEVDTCPTAICTPENCLSAIEVHGPTVLEYRTHPFVEIG